MKIDYFYFSKLHKWQKNILEIFMLNTGIKPEFYESEYNKYYEDALFGSDELDKFSPDIVYLHTTNKNIISYPELKDSKTAISALLDKEIERYKAIWTALSKYNCPIIQNNFDYTMDRSLGNLDCYDIHGKTYFINQLNSKFAQEAKLFKSLYINDINYVSTDVRGNKYQITAKLAEIKIENSDVMFLTDVIAFVFIRDKDTVKITSNFGKYNSKNYDTIFSDNVIVIYPGHKITGEYLDFSFLTNLGIFTTNVIYTGEKTNLFADEIEMNLTTKDTKIFMNDDGKKVLVVGTE